MFSVLHFFRIFKFLLFFLLIISYHKQGFTSVFSLTLVYISFHSVHFSSYSARNLPKHETNLNIRELNLKMSTETEKGKIFLF